MALVILDRVKETTSTSGTGTLSLSGAVSGFQSFSNIGNANTTYYTIESNADWEVGVGTYTSSGSTLSRDTVLASSASGSKITVAPGAFVWADYPAGRAVSTDNAVTLTNKTISGSSNTLSNIANASLTNSSITINGSSVSLGGSASVGTVTSITAGTGLSGGTITGSGTIAIDSTVATLTGTQTLTNKRITARVTSITGAAGGTITPAGDTSDQYNITALGATCSFAAPSGTPTDGQKLSIRIYSASAQTISSWDAIYRVIGTTLPTASGAGKTIYVGCVYNSADAKWDVVAVATQA